jgi:hypothetical protein
MKQIIIFILILILAAIGYGQYSKYKRFSLTEYEYKVPESLDVNSAEKGLLIDYYEAVETVNGHVITQWSSEGIDVRNPSDDDEEELAAVSEYRKKLANVKFYEVQLLNPSEGEKPKEALSEKELKNQITKGMFYANPAANTLRSGERSALVYEIQRLLIEKGYSIKHDGLFSVETFNAIKAFEEKNNLFPDGKLDAITLEYLLK